MSYLYYLQQSRWIKGWSDNYGGSYYSIRIGNDGKTDAMPQVSRKTKNMPLRGGLVKMISTEMPSTQRCGGVWKMLLFGRTILSIKAV